MHLLWWRKSQPKPGVTVKSPHPPTPPSTRPPTQQSDTSQPSSEELYATLQSHFDRLTALLRSKLAQTPNIYHHDTNHDNDLNHKIRKEIRQIRGHPYFPDIENDMSEELFHVGWGRLESEVARWGKGSLKNDRGRLTREQGVIKGIFKEWKLEVPDEKKKKTKTLTKEKVSNPRGQPERPTEKKFWKGRLINEK